MQIISNHDLNFGGMPAINRALNALAAHVNDLRNQVALLEIADAQRVQRIAILEGRLDALTRPPAPADETDHPNLASIPPGAQLAESWLSDSWVTTYTTAADAAPATE